MPGRTNIFEPEWEREVSRGQFEPRGFSVGRGAGASKRGATVYEIPPGNKNLAGAHQLMNVGEEPARAVMVSSELSHFDGELEDNGDGS